jgi:predicted ATPase
MRRELRTWKEENDVLIQRDEEERASKQYRAITSWLKIDESEQLKIFESIADEATKYPGTCSWITNNRKIRLWLQRRSDTPFIWLQGKAGSGKSVLTTQVSKFIQASGLSVICHICTDSHATSTKYEHIIRSILLQLLRLRRSGELLAYVYQEFVIGKKLPTILALEQLLQALLQALSDEPRNAECLWIILDGLDECETGKQARLVSLLNQVASNEHGGTVCKVLISSRPSPTLIKRLHKKEVVSLSDEWEELKSAIKKYTSLRLQSLHDRLEQLDLESDDIEEIVNVVARKADGTYFSLLKLIRYKSSDLMSPGMFLYARLVLDYLGTNIFISGEELKESIHVLPETLSDL